MKKLLFILSISCLCLFCTKKKKTIIKNKKRIVTEIDYDSLPQSISLSKSYTKDSLLLFNKFMCKKHVNNTSKYISLKFKDCDVNINEIKLNPKFKLLETNHWLEESIQHKDLYYKIDNYIVIFDYLKYCNTSIPENYILESIRIYSTDNYLQISNQSNSIKYYLKTIK